jgi:hypothetical protein
MHATCLGRTPSIAEVAYLHDAVGRQGRRKPKSTEPLRARAPLAGLHAPNAAPLGRIGLDSGPQVVRRPHSSPTAGPSILAKR